MSKCTDEKLGCSFELPDKPTVRQQLAWTGAVTEARGKSDFERYWEGAKTLITNWQCEIAPDPEALDLDTETNPKVTRVVIFAGLEAVKLMNHLEDVPKN